MATDTTLREPARDEPRPMTANLLFNSTPLAYAGRIEQPTRVLVKNTPGLWNASAEDALLYGGDLTRAALGAMNLRNDRKYVVVDTKIHMLKPGMWPAIPGWHTDGVPRGQSYSPTNGVPNIWRQLDVRSPRFHLLVTGDGCLTEFVDEPVTLPVPVKPTTDLYSHITREVNRRLDAGEISVVSSPSCRVVEWDWWALHRGVAASLYEWRFLIRVTETDYLEPQRDLRAILRTQQQVYVPSEAFGW